MGTTNLTALGSPDIFISKLDASGNFVWAKAMGGIGGYGSGNSLALDPLGNVYTTGNFNGTTDFDPGAGISNLTSGSDDIFISKLDASGNFIWAKAMGGSFSSDMAYSIALDPFGNVYTTGYFSATVDFDPGAGTANLTSAGGDDIFVSKLDALGNFVWAKAMGGAGTDRPFSIALDAQANVYTTGSFSGMADFNPGVGTINLTALGSPDIFISKLDATGNFVWAKAIGGTSVELAYSIALDPLGNVYTAGYFSGIVDFDPGAGTTNLTAFGGSGGVRDIFISKLDASGNFVWAKAIGGANNDEEANSISLDASGNIYTTGFFQGTVDFDPGTGTATLTSAGFYDIFISKLGCGYSISNVATANAVCAGQSLTLTASGANSYIWIEGGATTASIVVSPTISTNFIVAGIGAASCIVFANRRITVNPSPTISVSGKTLVCSGKPTILTASGASSYLWGTGALTNIAVVTPTQNTVYSVTGTNSFSCASTNNFTVNTTVIKTPSICLVSVDSVGLNNKIYWVTGDYPEADTFYVMREIANQAQLIIGRVPKSAPGQFVDNNFSIGGTFNGNPVFSSYSYRIQIKDTCGNLSNLSQYHTSIHVTDLNNGSGAFSYNTYVINGVPLATANYNLCRWDITTGATFTVASVNAGGGNITDPQWFSLGQSGNVKWFIETSGFACAANLVLKGSGILGQGPSKTKSNNTNERQFPSALANLKIDPASITIYPNPANKNVLLNLNFPVVMDFEYKIVDVTGRIISTQILESPKQEIQLAEIPAGLYFCNIYSGTTFICSKKLILEH